MRDRKKSEPVTRRPEYAVSRPVFRPNPATWGLFSPLFAAHSPETPPFSPRRPAVFPAKPRRKPPFPRRGHPVFPVSTRHCAPSCRPKRARCAPFPGKTARFCPRQPGFFPLCARSLPAIPPVLRPRSPRASQPPALGVRRRPEFRLPLGLPPHPAAPLRRGEACPPRGASIPGSDSQETAAQSLTKFRKIQGFFPA